MNSVRPIILFCCAALLCGCRPHLAAIQRNCAVIDRLPLISPDYTGVTIPPNIAPLNFTLRDSCAVCVAEIASVKGTPIAAWGRRGSVRIDAGAWKRLCAENAGKPLRITLYARGNRGAWRRYATIEDTIAAEPIDRYCTYRILGYQYNYSSDLREYERDLTSFDETLLVNSRNYSWGCVNCHMPFYNDPRRFVLQVRSTAYGSETLIADGDSIATLASRLGYASWHPGGRFIAFSVYKVEQYFHARGRQIIDVCDNNSHIIIYDMAARSIVPSPLTHEKEVLETWPAWSPDGRYLYFCSAAVPPGYSATEPPVGFEKVRYSLLRIAYDPGRNVWGAVDTVLCPEETGLSIAQPRLSPDNRFCLFCMQNYGAYPHAQESSDLYLMDLATRRYCRLPINSEYHESWHAWSKNGRWIMFSSKRGGGIFTRLYFSHVDSQGNARKPFLLPQRDGSFYDAFIKCYNVPEFAIAPVRFSERRLLKAIKTENRVAVPVPQDSAAASAKNAPNEWVSGNTMH
jgi:hypothetical protein